PLAVGEQETSRAGVGAVDDDAVGCREERSRGEVEVRYVVREERRFTADRALAGIEALREQLAIADVGEAIVGQKAGLRYVAQQDLRLGIVEGGQDELALQRIGRRGQVEKVAAIGEHMWPAVPPLRVRDRGDPRRRAAAVGDAIDL